VALLMPLISIITPFRNAEAFLPGLVQTVQAQTCADWECLLVDDGSEDGGAALLERCCAADRRFRRLPLPLPAATEPRLPARPRNHALARVRSPLVAFLDCDDLWHPRKLELQLAFHQQRQLDLSVTAYARFRGLDQPPLALRCPPPQLGLARLRRSNPIPLLTVLIRTELLQRGFPPVPHEDYLLWLDLFRAHPDLRYAALPSLLAFYRLHVSNQSRHLSQVTGWTYRVFRRHGLGRGAALRQLLLWGGHHALQLLTDRIGGTPALPVRTLQQRSPLDLTPGGRGI